MKITSYDPLIYPRKLWVVTEPIETELNETFGFFDLGGNEIMCDISILEGKAGCTCLCYEKSTQDKGVMVFMDNKEVRTIAHESVHVADAVFEQLDITTQGFTDGGNEAYAYMVGWVAKCIEEGGNNQ